MKPALLWACLLCAGIVGCGQFVVAIAPVKQATEQRSAISLQSDTLFWEALHGGKYERIPELLQQLTAVYLEHPDDPVAAAHIGWVHIWRMAERARLSEVPATITDSIVLARKYFEEAVKMEPDDPRYLGFLASATMVEGGIHQDQRLLREGFFQMLDAIDRWPEFNLFTAGYVLSGQPANTLRYQQALTWQWRNLDACAGERVDRRNPDYAKYMLRKTSQGTLRVCWNSWMAPHNFEGFFLNLGDMLVKDGDWRTAQVMYANARLSPSYMQWPFREVLEERITKAEANVASFSSELDVRGGDPAQPHIMNQSAFSCMACHQTSEAAGGVLTAVVPTAGVSTVGVPPPGLTPAASADR